MVRIANGLVAQEIVLPAHESPADIFLVFHVGRGQLLGVRPDPEAGVAAFPARRSWADVALPPNVLHVAVSARAAPSRVTVLSLAEPLELLKIVATGEERVGPYAVYVPPAEKDAPEPPTKDAFFEIFARTEGRLTGAEREELNAVLRRLQCAPPAAPALQRNGNGDVAGELLAEGDYYAALQAAIGKGSTDVDAARRFFSDLDAETHPRLVGHRVLYPYDRAFRHMTVASLTDDLLKWLETRLVRYYRHPDLKAREYVPSWPTRQRDLDQLAPLFRGLAEQHFPGGTDGVDRARFERACEWFANGELRIQLDVQGTEVWACQPSSGFYYLFGELALCMARVQPRDAFWSAAANAFVRTQPVFSTVYAPDPIPGDAALQHYRASNFKQTVQSYWQEPKHRDGLAALYANVAGDELHCRAAGHAVTFFPGLCPAD